MAAIVAVLVEKQSPEGLAPDGQQRPDGLVPAPNGGDGRDLVVVNRVGPDPPGSRSGHRDSPDPGNRKIGKEAVKGRCQIPVMDDIRRSDHFAGRRQPHRGGGYGTDVDAENIVS